MSIELNRFHRARIKKNRRFYWGRDLLKEPDILSVVVDTPKPHCRCIMCIKTRKREGITMQEKKAIDIFYEAT